jgi:hypothetical protein
VRLHAARNMPPVPSTHVGIVCAASAHVNVRTFYQPLTALTGLGLLGIAPRRSFSGRAARGSVAPRKMACRPLAGKARKAVQGHRLAQRGAACRCPFLIGSGNGRQDAQSYFARRSVALLRWCRLDLGLFCFGLYLHCARWSRRSQHSLGPLGLTWTRTISRSSAPQPRVHPASGATTTTMCLPRARPSVASSSLPHRPWARHGFGRWPMPTSKTARRLTATRRHARLRWQRSRRVGGANDHLRRLQETPIGVSSSVIRKNQRRFRWSLTREVPCGSHGSSFFSLPSCLSFSLAQPGQRSELAGGMVWVRSRLPALV